MSSLRAFLEERERELLAALAPLRAQTDEIEGELREVRRAQHALLPPEELEKRRRARVSHGEETIQDMIAAVIVDFPFGVGARRLVQEVGVAFNRAVARESLAPQLSRMARAGEVRHEGRLWFPSIALLDAARPKQAPGDQ